MKLAHFYHVYADGHWREPVEEHLAALRDFHGPLRIGIVGGEASRRQVREYLSDRRVLYGTVETSTGNEAVTIRAVEAYVRSQDGAVLYAHTKGAADNSDFRARWRRSMTARLVAEWSDHRARLDAGDVDAIGCHWLTREVFGDMVPVPFFGGNFWMARCDYLRTLPRCKPEPRYEAERWIGYGCPRVVDLLPGWPDDNRWPELCAS